MTRPQSTAAAPTRVSFNVATFNVLGGGHSKGRGGMRSGTARMKGAISYLRKHDVVLAGFQELEGKQAASLRKRTKNRWVVVGAPSRNGKKIDTRNSIGYRKSSFTLVRKAPADHLLPRQPGEHPAGEAEVEEERRDVLGAQHPQPR